MLFVCVHNGGRSQMATSFFQRLPLRLRRDDLIHVIPVLVLAAQVLVVLGLRSRDAALQTIAVAAAGLGCLVLVGVSLGIGFEIAGGGAPVWLGPSTGVSVAAGLFYLAAIISWIRARVRGRLAVG